MKKKTKRRCQKIIAMVLLVCFTLQPLGAFANTIVDVTANSNTEIQQKNNVVVVNIATPNANGLSHNKYTDFNVTTNGLILNNATQNINTTLAGNINANVNLNG